MKTKATQEDFDLYFSEIRSEFEDIVLRDDGFHPSVCGPDGTWEISIEMFRNKNEQWNMPAVLFNLVGSDGLQPRMTVRFSIRQIIDYELDMVTDASEPRKIDMEYAGDLISVAQLLRSEADRLDEILTSGVWAVLV